MPQRFNRFSPLVALIASLLITLPTIALAEDNKNETMTIHDLLALKQVEEVALAPDGQTLAFVVEVPRDPMQDEDGKAWTELHVADADGNSRAFVAGAVEVEEIAWRPGSSEISFLSKREGDENDALYVIDHRGGEAHKILEVHSNISDYSWSPDGKSVAIIAKRAQPEKHEELKEKGFSQKIFEEDWLPKEAWIANIGHEGDPEKLELAGSVQDLLFSPDGKHLALKIAPTPSVDDSLINTKVNILNLGSKKLTEFDNPGKLGDMAWSPNSSQLAFISAADLNDPHEGRLVVVPATGGPLKDLLPDLEGHIERLAWEDDAHLLFLSDEGVEVRLGRIDSKGKNQETILPLGGPIWREMSRAASGDVALIGDTPEHPEEAFLLTKGSDKPRRLTNINPQLENFRLAPQEVVRYKARDGLEIEGLLIRPLDEKKGQRYPLVMVVHGGPEAHYRNGWLNSYSRPGQTFAAAGFAVFYPNYRASTGRGVAFSKLDHGDPAGKQFDDLVDGVDHLIEIGLVDRDRVGITGGSYGGYATAWGATYYSERYAAAVMSVGISDKVSKFGTSDIPQELYQVHDQHWPWEDWDLARERSPVFHVQKSKTPILILHGEDDTRVHPSQSLILHRYLKVLDKTVRLILYPDEGHGNQRAASRLDYSLRLMRWMQHYLQGPGGEPPHWEIDYAAK